MSFICRKFVYSINKRAFSSTIPVLAHWNKDWKPGKYPVTEEERLAAAKKYNLLPVEYKPIDDDGQGAGDYPDFKPYSVEGRDPFYPWDYPEYRRNFGEALHEDMNIYGEDRYDVSYKPRYSYSVMLASFLGGMGLLGLMMYLGEDLYLYPAMPQHMPQPGVKHYKYS